MSETPEHGTPSKTKERGAPMTWPEAAYKIALATGWFTFGGWIVWVYR